MPFRSPRWAAAAALLAIVVSMAGPGPTLAHDALVSSSPEDGQILKTSPAKVVLTFSGDLQDITPAILISRDDELVSDSKPIVDGRTITAPVATTLPDGQYTVAWRVVSSDGHPIQGSFAFAVGTGDVAPTRESPASNAGDTDSGGGSTQLLVGPIATALAGVVLLLTWLRRRGGNHS